MEPNRGWDEMCESLAQDADDEEAAARPRWQAMLDAVPSPASEEEPELPGWGQLLDECGGSSQEEYPQVEEGAHDCAGEKGAEERVVLADVATPSVAQADPFGHGLWPLVVGQSSLHTAEIRIVAGCILRLCSDCLARHSSVGGPAGEMPPDVLAMELDGNNKDMTESTTDEGKQPDSPNPKHVGLATSAETLEVLATFDDDEEATDKVAAALEQLAFVRGHWAPERLFDQDSVATRLVQTWLSPLPARVSSLEAEAEALGTSVWLVREFRQLPVAASWVVCSRDAR